MTEPTLVPKQFQTQAAMDEIKWTVMPETLNIVSYALLECDEVWTEWKTWADSGDNSNQAFKDWDGSKYIMAYRYDTRDTTGGAINT